MELARLDLCEVHDDLYGELTAPPEQILQRGDELFVGERRDGGPSSRHGASF